MLTYFVVQAYTTTRMGAIVTEAPIQAESGEHACALARRIAGDYRAAIAFSRRGDPATGEWEDAKILGAWGELPDVEEGVAMAC
ncbi:MAG TPA: hypothetical protein VGV39_15225 [Mesorhizobium sp.]|jgi:hypothetical protein|uniref:hypothetical protein n=1 Tax=Mesorhizobium sp. TaxID=1871066 RepID=UPI002DDCECBF|nr:hypothetical protein [Mesorhizobium sp.]HEV2504429.1 hypothetical protein [Mesorhizobium sp.]